MLLVVFHFFYRYLSSNNLYFIALLLQSSNDQYKTLRQSWTSMHAAN
jgi:hypothetical protein